MRSEESSRLATQAAIGQKATSLAGNAPAAKRQWFFRQSGQGSDCSVPSQGSFAPLRMTSPAGAAPVGLWRPECFSGKNCQTRLLGTLARILRSAQDDKLGRFGLAARRLGTNVAALTCHSERSEESSRASAIGQKATSLAGNASAAMRQRRFPRPAAELVSMLNELHG